MLLHLNRIGTREDRAAGYERKWRGPLLPNVMVDTYPDDIIVLVRDIPHSKWKLYDPSGGHWPHDSVVFDEAFYARARGRMSKLIRFDPHQAVLEEIQVGLETISLNNIQGYQHAAPLLRLSVSSALSQDWTFDVCLQMTLASMQRKFPPVLDVIRGTIPSSTASVWDRL